MTALSPVRDNQAYRRIENPIARTAAWFGPDLPLVAVGLSVGFRFLGLVTIPQHLAVPS